MPLLRERRARFGGASPSRRRFLFLEGGRPLPPHDSRRSGATLVELLVVCLIVTAMAVSVGRMLAAALALEQRYRRESDVMESIADNLAYAERYYSLASSVTNGVASFRLEAGGVSFETNHWLRVSSVAASLACEINYTNLAYAISSGDPAHDTNAVKQFSADGKQRIAPASVTNISIQGAGNMRRIRMAATGRADDGSRYEVYGERPVRLWNAQ
ncbi:MAG: hypothetical protein PHR35_09600 [Kiritimatiellae bacterium]|nr:hypothetical protein [Kiritimatiellia bacterium]